MKPTNHPDRYKPCPSCGDDVDTWLAGTTAAHRTNEGVLHGECYLAEQEQRRRTV